MIYVLPTPTPQFIRRPKPEDMNRAAQATGQTLFGQQQSTQGRKIQAGYVEDQQLLDNITDAIQEAIIGANGFHVLVA